MALNQDTHTSEVNIEKDPMEKLEEALVICKFGRFHLFLMVTTLLSVMATTAVTTTTSFVLPIAECDLKMNMMQKGLLNAVPFLGQLFACLFTGFITDTFGRRIFLYGGNLGIFFCTVFGASSQNYSMLLVGKLMEGICMSLVFTATATMVTEFTHKDVRDRVLVSYSSFMSISIIICSLLAWGVLPQPWQLATNYFEIHSWNIYLYASSTWSLVAAIFYWILPESPKFLLSHGQENEALEVLKDMYYINTGRDKESFPIKSLSISGLFTPTAKTTIKKQLTNGIFESKELFRRPLVFKLILFSTTTLVCLWAYSAMRLWFPQLSTIVENYEYLHTNHSDKFCTIMNDYQLTKKNNVDLSELVTHAREDQICEPQISGSKTYTNGIILGMCSLVLITATGYLVDFFGQKPLMVIFLVICSVCSSALYWTNSSIQIAILISATCASMQTAFSLQHNILVRVFPTTIRSTALSLVLMAGRIGSITGNILFPVMLELGCMVPFVTLTAVTICTVGLVYLFPNPRKENVKGDK